MQNQQQAQQERQQRIHEYVQGVLGALEKSPGSLSKTERRFGAKYAETHQKVRQIEGELTQLREQIRQGEARIRSLELQHQAESGRAGGFLESLVSLKFDEDDATLPPAIIESPGRIEEAKVEGGDNGTQKPSSRAAVPPAQV